MLSIKYTLAYLQFSGHSCVEDEWELTAVNPSLSLGNFGLHCCEPGVSQDGFLVSKVSEEESEPHLLITSLHF